jgi:hypothetical protein
MSFAPMHLVPVASATQVRGDEGEVVEATIPASIVHSVACGFPRAGSFLYASDTHVWMATGDGGSMMGRKKRREGGRKMKMLFFFFGAFVEGAGEEGKKNVMIASYRCNFEIDDV